MKRSAVALLVGALLAAPLSVKAQQVAKLRRIGLLCSVFCTPPTLDAFIQRLRENGYVPGRNLVIEERRADDKERLLDDARDLVAGKPDALIGRPLRGLGIGLADATDSGGCGYS